MDSNIVLLQLAAKQEKHRNFTLTASYDNYTIYVDGTFTSPIYSVQGKLKFTCNNIIDKL